MKSAVTVLAAATLLATTLATARAQEPTAPPTPPTTPTTPTTPPPPPPPPAPVDEESDKRFTIGPEVGFYFPTNARTRSAFGSTWINYGVGLRPIQLVSQKGAAGLDLNIISTTGTGRKAFMIPVTLIYKRAIGGMDPKRSVTPYVGASLGALFADLRSDNYNVHSGFRGGFGGTAVFGLTFKQKAYIEARYEEFSKIKGFDLSGTNIAAGFRF